MNKKEEVKKEILELRTKTEKWAREYYQEDAPSVSDAEYDGAYSRILEIESEFPNLKVKNSITKRVGAPIDNRFKKVRHNFKMLSLSNAFNFNELNDFDKKVKKEVDSSKVSYVSELKIDGLSISLHYKEGVLKQALTRGDGVYGEDVTHNVLMIEDIPRIIKYKKELEVRGEVYIKLDDFKELKKLNNFANPRNAAAGSLRQLNSNVTKERKLSSFIYMIPNPLDHNLKTHKQTLDFIDQLGFIVNKETKFHNTIDSLVNEVINVIKYKGRLNYQIDGVVIKVNQVELYEDIGYTVKFPKYMIAYKFAEEKVVTTLEKIFITIGRTGRVTYNAKLTPVKIGGTTVMAATLHNSDYINKIGINVGDRVNIKKAGEIIPKVLSVYEKINNNKWEEDKVCPSCQTKLIRKKGEVDQYCPNKNCDSVRQARIEHFVSRSAMNIEGVSSEIIRRFIKTKFIYDISDLYFLKNYKDRILEMPGFKITSVNKIILAIEKSKKQELSKFIFALGIRHIGSKNAKIIARRFGNISSIISASKNDILNIRELGPKVANSLIEFFKNEKNILMIEKMNLELKDSATQLSKIFNNKTFVITGTLSMPRNHFSTIIELNGGNVSNSISSKTSYLLAGEKAGSKLLNAKKANIEVLSEEAFNKLLEKENHEG